jgi:hypothetical protein
MAINLTSRKMPTGDGNPTAGSAINRIHFLTLSRSDTKSKTIPSAYSWGWQSLQKTDSTTGSATYEEEFWEIPQQLHTPNHSALFLARMEGRL